MLRTEVLHHIDPLRRVQLLWIERLRVVSEPRRVARLFCPVVAVASRITVVRKRSHVEVDERHDLMLLIQKLRCGGENGQRRRWRRSGARFACIIRRTRRCGRPRDGVLHRRGGVVHWVRWSVQSSSRFRVALQIVCYRAIAVAAGEANAETSRRVSVYRRCRFSAAVIVERQAAFRCAQDLVRGGYAVRLTVAARARHDTGVAARCRDEIRLWVSIIDRKRRARHRA